MEEVPPFYQQMICKAIPKSRRFLAVNNDLLMTALEVQGELLELYNWLNDNYGVYMTAFGLQEKTSIKVRRCEVLNPPSRRLPVDDVRCEVMITANNRVIDFSRLRLQHLPYNIPIYIDSPKVQIMFDLIDDDNYLRCVKAQIILLSSESWERVGDIYLIDGVPREIQHRIVYLSLIT